MLLRTRIIALTSLGILAVVIVMTLASRQIQHTAELRFEHASTQAKQLLWNKIISSEQDAMEASMSGLTRDRKLRKVLRAGDKTAIKDNAITTYYRLSASKVVDRIDISNANSELLFSSPDNHPGWGNDPLIARTINEGKIHRGIVNLAGKAFVQITFPLNFRGKLIGVGIYSKKLDQAVTEFKNLSQSDVAIIAPEGDRLLSTNTQLFDQIQFALPETASSQFIRIDHQEKVLALNLNPIKDPEGKLIAYLATASDESDSYLAEDRAVWTSLVISLLVIASVMIGFTLYIRKAFGPMDRVVTNLQQVAAGDLNIHPPKTNSHDEVGKLVHATDAMAGQLRQMIEQVRAMAKQLQNSIQGMDTIVAATGNGVQQQLKETRRVNEAVTEMSASVSQVAEHAEAAANNAQQANKHAVQSEAVVKKSIAAIENMSQNINESASVINQLNQSSQEIGSVLDVIRGIADQTNLLALNAAIEAARAGEQGRGFAVVADEVRTLASRTQQSTQDIQNTIEQLQSGSQQAVSSMEHSIAEVEVNLQHSHQTEESLSTIAKAIEDINNMSHQIAEATESQARTTQDISANVHNINQLAEKSASGAEETSDCSRQINTMANELNQLVAHFKM